VGGSAPWAALAWATHKVDPSGADLVVVHVCPHDSPLARIAGEPPPALVELRDPPLARAVGAARNRLGGDRVALRIGYADEHGVPLAAAHVSEQDDDDYFYDETTLSTHFTMEPAALDLFASKVEPWSLKYPKVRVRRAVLHGAVADGLARAAAGAHLLVVGDKPRGPVSRTRSGDVPFALIRRAGCPTAIVPVNSWVGETR
jgi:hypothetical protein